MQIIDKKLMYNEIREIYDLPCLTELELNRGDVALMRVDFSVPIKNGVINDASRIERCKATLDYLVQRGVIVLLASHFGRPDLSLPAEKLAKFSFKDIANQIGESLNYEITMVEPGAAPGATHYSSSYIKQLKELVEKIKAEGVQKDSIFLLENLRFFPEEKKSTQGINLAQGFAELIDVYINDAFSASHRDHISITGFPIYAKASAPGFAMLDELYALNKFADLEKAKNPLILISGSKVKTKLPLLKSLAKKVKNIALSGVIANTFLKAKGGNIGDSLYESDMLEEAKDLMQQANFILPADYVCLNEETNKIELKTLIADKERVKIYDVGPRTIKILEEYLAKSDVFLWCGPLGKYEEEAFASGTKSLVDVVAKQRDLIKVAGGGDTVAALKHLGAIDEEIFDYCSTGGGAFIDWLTRRVLPGISALSKTRQKIYKNRPRHVAFIMDGNSRWSDKEGMARLEGYTMGIEAAERVCKICKGLDIKYITLYAFSYQNFLRPKDEIEEIMALFLDYIGGGMRKLVEEGAKISFIGDRSLVSRALVTEMEKIEQESRGGEYNVQVAIGYGGRESIRKAAFDFAKEAIAKSKRGEDISEMDFDKLVMNEEFKEPDLIVRTGGDMRLSNFMPWESIYSELYFTKCFWPDFDEPAFYEALVEFSYRKRRYGMRQ